MGLFSGKEQDESIQFIDRNLKETQFILHNEAMAIVNEFSRKPYPTGERRIFHGSAHGICTGLLTIAITKLYIKYANPEVLKDLNPRTYIGLICAGLFHDSGRETDGGKDTAESEERSASNCYFYLINKLNFDHETAKYIAESIANKDTKTPGHNIRYSIKHVIDNKLEWEQAEIDETYTRNIVQEILNAADTLEIIRVLQNTTSNLHIYNPSDDFNREYLEFYQRFYENKDAMEDLSHLISAERRLLYKIGYKCDPDILTAFQDSPDPFHAILHEIQTDPDLEYLKKLLDNPNLLAREEVQKIELYPKEEYDFNLPLDEKQILIVMNKGLVIFRGIQHESDIVKEYEYLFKHGVNKNRSCTLLYCNKPLFNLGLLVIDPSPESIIQGGNFDINSGNGKKKYMRIDGRVVSGKNAWQSIIDHVKSGKNIEFNELIVDIDVNKIRGIAFYVDHHMKRDCRQELCAIYLQQKFVKDYEDKYGKKIECPIFMYTPCSLNPKKYNYDNDKLFHLWEDYIAITKPYLSRSFEEFIKDNSCLLNYYDADTKKILLENIKNIFDKKINQEFDEKFGDLKEKVAEYKKSHIKSLFSGYDLRLLLRLPDSLISSHKNELTVLINNFKHTYNNFIFTSYNDYIMFDLFNNKSIRELFSKEKLDEIKNDLATIFDKFIRPSDEIDFTNLTHHVKYYPHIFQIAKILIPEKVSQFTKIIESTDTKFAYRTNTDETELIDLILLYNQFGIDKNSESFKRQYINILSKINITHCLYVDGYLSYKNKIDNLLSKDISNELIDITSNHFLKLFAQNFESYPILSNYDALNNASVFLDIGLIFSKYNPQKINELMSIISEVILDKLFCPITFVYVPFDTLRLVSQGDTLQKIVKRLKSNASQEIFNLYKDNINKTLMRYINYILEDKRSLNELSCMYMIVKLYKNFPDILGPLPKNIENKFIDLIKENKPTVRFDPAKIKKLGYGQYLPFTVGDMALKQQPGVQRGLDHE